MNSSQLICMTQSAAYTLTECVYFRFVKERYTPYSLLEGQWYFPQGSFEEVTSIAMIADGNVVHIGYPCSAEIISKDGRNILKIRSMSYTDALAKNQPTAGLITNIDLVGLANSAMICPNVDYESGTPVVNYVNYYDGTSIWDAICCYAIRATGLYPYIRGTNTVRVSRPSETTTLTTTSQNLLKRSCGTNYSNLISDISEADVSGNAGGYAISDSTVRSKNIVRKKEIVFDREWIMDPDSGLLARINYSKRGMIYDSFTIAGFWAIDLLDYFIVTDLPFVGEIDKIEITGGMTTPTLTTLTCYHDAYCA